ncbi:GPI mannosyltransferase 3-like [Penaeus monodon]|uniref:GPI mannosyltransferase 3-like n=1 Tax=Penaeus monodon TaxID=6687 RepID=UPI0018A700F2|nr:GPI mannosyltransferase 3-like [Penaeus monodon]
MIPRPLWTFLLVRLSSVFLVQTWFVADEYWQATEVAHNIAFGYGYLTWEWKEGLRSILYPGVLACLYKVLAVFSLDYPLLLIHLPRVLHACAFAVGDFFTWKLSQKLYNKDAAHWTYVCLMSSWFLEYCAPRTLTSCLEMVLTSVALWFYPWKSKRESCNVSYLWLVGISCILRPTSAVLFVPLCLHHVWASNSRLWLTVKFSAIIFAVLALSIGLDSWYYGQLVVVPWRFAHFNIASGLAAHYGTHPWHWYLTQGLPATLTIHIVPFLLGAVCHSRRHKHLLPLCVWSIFVYSCLGHKEFRFLLPVLPLCLCIAGDYIAVTIASLSKKKDLSSKQWSLIVAASLWIPNILAMIYLGLFHQRGPLDTMTVIEQELNTVKEPDVLFLMPCHSTPYYGHLHRNISMRFLTCEPNLKHQENYIDEADIFERNPMSWLQQEYKSITTQDSNISHHKLHEGKRNSLGKSFPSHVVLFDVLVDRVYDFLSGNGFQKCHEIFHAHVEDGRRGRFIHIYCRV